MKQFLINGTLPPDLSKTGQWRFKKKAQQYTISNDKIISKGDGRIHAEDKIAVLKEEWSKVMGGRDKLYFYIKQKYDNISVNDCMKFLKGNTTSQLHQQVKKQKIFRTIVSKAPNERWLCDWITLPK